MRASNTNIASLVYWSARIVLAQTNGVITIGQYLFSVNNSTKAYSVSLTTQTTYTKDKADELFLTQDEVEDLAYYPVVVEGNFEETIALSNDDFNQLTQKDNVVLVWVRNDKIMSQMFKDYSISSQTVYYGTATYVDRYTNYFTVRIYKCTIDNTNQTCRITDNAKVAYDKAFLDAKLSEYLLNASASGDTLTINGIYNNSSATTTFDVSHKLDKNFSGVSYDEASSLGQNDYFVINVSGTPKKVSFQTIFTELGLGTVSHFLGTYSSLSALQTAHPTASAGDYAYITEVDGADTIITMAIWDSTDNEWQVQDLSQYVLDSVFQAYQLTVTQALNNKSKVTLVEWS